MRAENTAQQGENYALKNSHFDIYFQIADC